MVTELQAQALEELLELLAAPWDIKAGDPAVNGDVTRDMLAASTHEAVQRAQRWAAGLLFCSASLTNTQHMNVDHGFHSYKRVFLHACLNPAGWRDRWPKLQAVSEGRVYRPCPGPGLDLHSPHQPRCIRCHVID